MWRTYWWQRECAQDWPGVPIDKKMGQSVIANVINTVTLYTGMPLCQNACVCGCVCVFVFFCVWAFMWCLRTTCRLAPLCLSLLVSIVISLRHGTESVDEAHDVKQGMLETVSLYFAPLSFVNILVIIHLFLSMKSVWSPLRMGGLVGWPRVHQSALSSTALN